MPTDSPEYLAKKQQLSRILTIFGRKPVLEALQDESVTPYKLHLADTNQKSAILSEIQRYAQAKSTPITHHSRDALARISKNKKQDQGVALDIECHGFLPDEAFINTLPATFELMALDGVTNPQNVGMIIRSVCASPMTGLLLPAKGCAKLDALVIKASAGTLFKAKVIRCESLSRTLESLKGYDTDIVGVAATSNAINLSKYSGRQRKIFVMGNETHGLSKEVQKLCNTTVKIPMSREVESLNVSIAASLVAFREVI